MADYGVYEEMEKVYKKTGAKVVVNSAFKLQAGNFLIKSSQLDPMDGQGILINKAAISDRQLSEYGMQMIQSKFPILKGNMQLEEFGKRKSHPPSHGFELQLSSQY